MSRDRFESIWQFVHLSNPKEDEENVWKKNSAGKHCLIQIEPLYTQIMTTCRALFQSYQNIFNDERTVASKARIGVKQYVRDVKSTKWGHKLFILDDSSTGYASSVMELLLFLLLVGATFVPAPLSSKKCPKIKSSVARLFVNIMLAFHKLQPLAWEGGSALDKGGQSRLYQMDGHQGSHIVLHSPWSLQWKDCEGGWCVADAVPDYNDQRHGWDGFVRCTDCLLQCPPFLFTTSLTWLLWTASCPTGSWSRTEGNQTQSTSLKHLQRAGRWGDAAVRWLSTTAITVAVTNPNHTNAVCYGDFSLFAHLLPTTKFCRHFIIWDSCFTGNSFRSFQ